MSHASLSIVPFPVIAPEAVEQARRIARQAARAAAFAAQSIVAASVVWLMLAGPGVLTSNASTIAASTSTAR